MKNAPARHATLASYAIGFAASIALTLIAYRMVVGGALPARTLVAAILALAVVQLVVQMVFFLHLGVETGERLKLTTFIITVGLVLIVIAGAIWIMDHLNYNMLASPDAMHRYIQSQQAF